MSAHQQDGGDHGEEQDAEDQGERRDLMPIEPDQTRQMGGTEWPTRRVLGDGA